MTSNTDEYEDSDGEDQLAQAQRENTFDRWARETAPRTLRRRNNL